MSEFDVIVYGATGFTGRLVAENLGQRYPTGLNWAMGGRSLSKLEQVREEIGLPASIPLVTANADDPASLRAMCARTKVVLTTVGPYQLYGSELVAACAATGTAYVDLCGEPAWMRQMIDAHQAEAETSGARIVFSCGFDSIPFDLGVWTLQQAARARFGHPAPRVKGRVKAMKGGFSGGTAASLKATLAAGARDASVFKLMIDPFALTPGFEGPSQPKGLMPEYDGAVGGWVAPFIMAPINTKNVHRTNALSGHAYGADFKYDEMMVAPGAGRAWQGCGGGDGEAQSACQRQGAQAWRRPVAGRARERLLRTPVHRRNGRRAVDHRDRQGRPRSRLWLDQQDDR